jgi:hypothetical protein
MSSAISRSSVAVTESSCLESSHCCSKQSSPSLSAGFVLLAAGLGLDVAAADALASSAALSSGPTNIRWAGHNTEQVNMHSSGSVKGALSTARTILRCLDLRVIRAKQFEPTCHALLQHFDSFFRSVCATDRCPRATCKNQRGESVVFRDFELCTVAAPQLSQRTQYCIVT